MKILSLTLCILLASMLFVTPVLACNPPYLPKVTNVKIGDIVASSDPKDLLSAQTIAQIALEDINSYCTRLRIPYRFQVEIKVANGNTAIHLTQAQEFYSQGVRLLLAGRWSSQAKTSLSYINANKMLMLSPSATVPDLAIAGDNLFRLCPSDVYLGPALANTVWGKGVKHVIVIQRGDSWGDGLSPAFISEYTRLGGSLAGEVIRYATNEVDFTTKLATAEAQATAAGSEYGVVLLAFNEAATILNKLANNQNLYQKIYSCIWFGADGTANNQYIIDTAGAAAAHVGLYSLRAKEVHGPAWSSVESRYQLATGQIFNIYIAYEYDIFWVYALSVITAGSTNSAAVKCVLPWVAARYNGASGYCKLNTYGDRLNPGFDIWGYVKIDGSVQVKLSGFVDTNNVVKWY